MTEDVSQLLLAIGRYRSRYTLMMGGTIDQAPTKSDLERFGNTWFHLLKQPWVNAYAQLLNAGLVEEWEGRYTLTEAGIDRLQQAEVSKPLWWYEYENYYRIAPESEAHQAFCDRVYGLDLCQHGLVDQPQLEILLQELNLSPADHVLDLGCGNGFIPGWLARNTRASFIGVDLSPSGIRSAHPLASDTSTRLKFIEGNLNKLELPSEVFSAAISIDTMYYLDDVVASIKQVQEVLRPGGKLAVFFTQWVMDASEADRLLADGTDLARHLQALELPYTAVDLSDVGYAHWKTKLEVLTEMEAVFEKEGHRWLYDFRYREAHRYANWNRELTSRYLYIATV